MTERPDVIVVGDIMLDVGVTAGALAPGGDVHGEVRIRPAGSAANAAVWAAGEGARVRFHGRVGDDLPGRLLREALEARGVEARLTVDEEARTGAMLVVREAGDRSMVADRGANSHLSPNDLPDRLEAEAVLVSGYLVFDPGSEPAALAALERADARFVAIETSSWPLLETYGGERFLRATERADVLFANEREAEILWQARPSLHGPAALPFHHAFIKRGPGGATHIDGETGTGIVVPATPVDDPVDPTGAGDAFDGAVLAALVRGATVREAIERGCRAGALAVQSLETWPEER